MPKTHYSGGGCTDDDDWTQVALAQRGSQTEKKEALTRLFVTHWGRVARYAERRGLRDHEVEDFVQDVFVKLIRKIHKFKRDKTFHALLATIARNHFLDKCKKRTPRLNDEGTLVLDGIASKDWRSPERIILEADLLHHLSGKLSDRDWSLTEDRVRGLTHREISEKYNLKDERVARTTWSRVARKLRNLVKSKD